ncbi:hypothetical protein Tco_0715375 [Tanacetum coccineum]|uniref:Uncharacterized protein n=1 Tax=Tanacetum coccineum TaxID=301880 RepID=A0ABQ5C1S4_9ASTR
MSDSMNHGSLYWRYPVLLRTFSDIRIQERMRCLVMDSHCLTYCLTPAQSLDLCSGDGVLIADDEDDDAVDIIEAHDDRGGRREHQLSGLLLLALPVADPAHWRRGDRVAETR